MCSGYIPREEPIPIAVSTLGENENEENLLDNPVAAIAKMKEKKGKAKEKAAAPKYLWTNDAKEALIPGMGSDSHSL